MLFILVLIFFFLLLDSYALIFCLLVSQPNILKYRNFHAYLNQEKLTYVM